ncbi:hypothetical protein L6164_020173 [Bauhinia variegata]|uniref:Uncharacterized protein n=1 Tax=Bauhinia variegata TaxID=167791 RepID=A0ACB9MU73_BAUVA|nr:hypothetical protein L6164_020173 [Bauhinia variegata]
MGKENGEGSSLEETPTWAVSTVITLLVALGFLFHGTLKKFGKWLDRTKRKSLLAALEKIKEGKESVTPNGVLFIVSMGSKFKKPVVSENVRKSLSKWQRRVKERQGSPAALPRGRSTASDSGVHEMDESSSDHSISKEEGSTSGTKHVSFSHDYDQSLEGQTHEVLPSDNDNLHAKDDSSLLLRLT